MPRALQTAMWFRNAQRTLDQCHRRFGGTFHLRIAYQGTWVVLSDPGDVQSVFTGDPDVLYAGEGNAILKPLLGSHSVLVLDGPAHLEQRKLMLPAFHGERMVRYGRLIADVAGAEIESWPRGEVQRLRPRMQALTLEVILRAVLGVTDSQRRDALRFALRRLLTMVTDPFKASVLMCELVARARLRPIRPSLSRFCAERSPKFRVTTPRSSSRDR